MSYEVLARKWRPQQFDEVVGQGHVTQTLRNAILNQRIAHAYLFVGPRGVGKTSIARIMAKALNCQDGKPPDPCDKCDSCREIKEGRNLDVLEIDGASNTGVDHVRELRENVRYAPARGPYKIYIIDEVHMLSTGAFNALLKTLEEPPSHVKFFFATTEVQKIPATILSRCQRFDLRRIETKDITGHLAKLATEEKVAIDPDALLAIARGAEGGLRDAESALDQLIAFRGRKIAEADVLAVFGLASRESLDGIAQSLVKGDIPRLLKLIAELDAGGKDLQRLNAELLDLFRNVLVFMSTGDAGMLDVPESHLAAIKEIAGLADSAKILQMVDELVSLQGQMRFALSRRTILEVSLIRCARAASSVSIDDILKQLNQLKASLGSSPPSQAPSSAPPTPPAPPAVRETRPVSAPAPARAATAPDDELARLAGEWRDFVDKVSRYAPLAKSYLLDARPVAVKEDRVIIGFDPEFASNKEKIDVQRNVAAIQKTLAEMFGRATSVEFQVLGTKPPPVKPAAPAQAESSGSGAKKTRKDWSNDPAVKRALETFHGDIIDIRE